MADATQRAVEEGLFDRQEFRAGAGLLAAGSLLAGMLASGWAGCRVRARRRGLRLVVQRRATGQRPAIHLLSAAGGISPREPIEYYPRECSGCDTGLTHVRQEFIFLRDRTGVEPHGIVRLWNSDWSYRFFFSPTSMPYNRMFEEGEAYEFGDGDCHPGRSGGGSGRYAGAGCELSDACSKANRRGRGRLRFRSTGRARERGRAKMEASGAH